MPLILDTFNVLHTVGVLPPDLAGIDVQGLAALIVRSRYRAEKVVFACDGVPADDLPPPGPLASDSSSLDATVRYSGRASTADDLIGELINASTAPRRLTVVSSDHAVQRQARRRRCIVLTSQQFLQQLADDAHLPRAATPAARTIPPPMSQEQIDRWLHVFDVDETDLEVDAAATNPPEAPVAETRPAPAEAASTLRKRPVPVSDELPADLIADAEAILQREQIPHAPRPTSVPQPPPSSAGDVADAAAGDLDPAELDMNAILPADGRTQPLKEHHLRDRHR